MTGSALFDPSGQYRYRLSREWLLGQGTVAFIGLNPSTADASLDDPTIRRWIRFAQDWGFRQLMMVNLFAYRATCPAALQHLRDPVGPENDLHIQKAATAADLLVAAWGVHGTFRDRAAAVLQLLQGHALSCLGTTRGRHPRHPLFVPAQTARQPYPEKSEAPQRSACTGPIQ